MPFAKMRWPRSLRARLLAVFFVGMALSAGFVALCVLVFAKPFSRHMLESGIEDYTEAIANYVRFDAQGLPIGVDETRIERWIFTSLGGEVVLRILDDAGRVAYAPDAQPHALAPQGQAFDSARRSFALLNNGVPMHAATMPITHQGRRWYVQFATSDRLVLRVRQSIGMAALWQGIAATCLTFFVIFLITTHFTLRRALEPLRAASAAAQRITPRTLDERLDAQAQPDEIGPLVSAFNQALDRLQHGFRTQQEFLASAAHELKTPLALMRAQLELGTRDERGRLQLLQDIDHMSRQVQQLLMLAEVSEPRNIRIAPLDPRPAVEEVFNFMTRVAERHSVWLGLRVDDDVRCWHADRGALFTLLKNLIENAIQHSPAGGVVVLTVHRSGLAVKDQGPGVSAENLPRIFERFWRGPERREDGAGLGLTICQEIATAHGWRLQARCPAGGLEVRLAMDEPGLPPPVVAGLFTRPDTRW
jgi:signal transduction histidine kinase